MDFNFWNLINPKLPEIISQHYLNEGKIFYKIIFEKSKRKVI